MTTIDDPIAPADQAQPASAPRHPAGEITAAGQELLDHGVARTQFDLEHSS